MANLTNVISQKLNGKLGKGDNKKTTRTLSWFLEEHPNCVHVTFSKFRQFDRQWLLIAATDGENDISIVAKSWLLIYIIIIELKFYI
jgi:hypothetical protein